MHYFEINVCVYNNVDYILICIWILVYFALINSIWKSDCFECMCVSHMLFLFLSLIDPLFVLGRNVKWIILFLLDKSSFHNILITLDSNVVFLHQFCKVFSFSSVWSNMYDDTLAFSKMHFHILLFDRFLFKLSVNRWYEIQFQQDPYSHQFIWLFLILV